MAPVCLRSHMTFSLLSSLPSLRTLAFGFRTHSNLLWPILTTLITSARTYFQIQLHPEVHELFWRVRLFNSVWALSNWEVERIWPLPGVWAVRKHLERAESHLVFPFFQQIPIEHLLGFPNIGIQQWTAQRRSLPAPPASIFILWFVPLPFRAMREVRCMSRCEPGATFPHGIFLPFMLAQDRDQPSSSYMVTTLLKFLTAFSMHITLFNSLKNTWTSFLFLPYPWKRWITNEAGTGMWSPLLHLCFFSPVPLQPDR